MDYNPFKIQYNSIHFFAKSFAKLATYLLYLRPTRNLNLLELNPPPPPPALPLPHPSAFAQTPSPTKWWVN